MVNGPRIGITCSPRRRAGYYDRYFHAVEAAGGIPVVVEPWETSGSERAGATLGSLDGLLLPGGWDVDPPAYGEARTIADSEEIDKPLDSTEIELVRAAVDSGVPVFGICRGIQLINVALGGSLHQHIDGHDMHGHPRNLLAHSIDIDTGSELAEAMNATSLLVNSVHHQAVKRVAPTLQVTARAGDGTVEGLESPDALVVAVQCHPEELVDEQPWALALLSRFVERARTAAARKHAHEAAATA